MDIRTSYKPYSVILSVAKNLIAMGLSPYKILRYAQNDEVFIFTSNKKTSARVRRGICELSYAAVSDAYESKFV